MVTVAPHFAAHAKRTIDRASETNLEALNATRESNRVGRFDDEVHVVVLNGEFDDAERAAGVRVGDRVA